jgi:hypothetical protein
MDDEIEDLDVDEKKECRKNANLNETCSRY